MRKLKKVVQIAVLPDSDDRYARLFLLFEDGSVYTANAETYLTQTPEWRKLQTPQRWAETEES